MKDVRLYMCIVVVFFQAEDGIRDLVRSRGLGDVYKRQERQPPVVDAAVAVRLERLLGQPQHDAGILAAREPVSYTHLTLPTSDLV